MFYRYISENFAHYINKNEWDDDNSNFNYALVDDEKISEKDKLELIKEKGFFIYPSELFCNVQKNAINDKDLNETLSKVFKNIENSAKGTNSEKNFSGLFSSIKLNDDILGKTVIERNKKLVQILNGIGNIDFSYSNDNSIDIFGDAYEFLMSMYASNAGKSGGEYFTPQCVSELLMRLSTFKKNKVNKVYDPTCGSGSLLLQAIKILESKNIKNGLWGQESNITNYNLCRMNMFLHNVGYEHFNIAHGDTLIEPDFNDNPSFDVIVSNPPYSISWEVDNNPGLITDSRFAPAGVLAPKSKADFAFIMHSLYYLANDGIASIVCFPGIMYRGGKEQDIREYLVSNNFVDCIIELPDNLFFGTPIVTCIMVLKKQKQDNNVLFIDAKKEFVKVTNSNKLSSNNIQNILDIYEQRTNIDYVSKVVSNEEIKNNEYNLSVSTYVEKEDTTEKVDIVKLNQELDEIVKKENKLRLEIDKIIRELEVQ